MNHHHAAFWSDPCYTSSSEEEIEESRNKMSVIYVQIPSFVSTFGIHIQTLILVSITLDKNFKKLYCRSNKHFKLCTESIIRMFLTYTFNKVPTGLFRLVFMSHGTQMTTMRNKRDQKMADCQTPD